MLKKRKSCGKKRRKNWVKIQITVELLNDDNGSRKKVGDFIKEELEKNLPGVKGEFETTTI